MPKLKPSAVIRESSKGIPEWSIALVLGFTALLYIRALFNQFAWDDLAYVQQNGYLRDFSVHGIKAIFSSFYFGNYHPLTTLTFLFEYTLYKLNPLPYHLFNVVLHLLNTWLVFKLTGRLSGSKLAALIVALLFAVHPMHVESVAWISGRKDLLYGMFFLLSLLVYLKYLASGYKKKFYALALLMFVLSLLSKSAAVTLPLVLLAIDYYKGRRFNVAALLEKIPFLLLSMMFGILALKSQYFEDTAVAHYDLFSTIILVFSNMIFYIIKLVVPYGLSAMHFGPEASGGYLPWYYYVSLPLLAVLVWLVLRQHKARKESIFGALFFLLTVSLMLYVAYGTVLTAERYTYISYIGLFFIAGHWISSIQAKKKKQIAVSIISVCILIFSFASWMRTGTWKNNIVLFTDVIEKNPDVYNGYWIRGNFRKDAGDLRGAMQDYEMVIKLKPRFADVYISRGIIYEGAGNTQAALGDYNKAIATDPLFSTAWYTRGNILADMGDTLAAFRDYDKAIELNPRYTAAYSNRALLRSMSGDQQGALKDFNAALSISPGNADLYFQRAYVRTILADHHGALSDYNECIRLNPGDAEAWYKRGFTKQSLGDSSGAVTDWKKAMSLGYDPYGN